MRNGACGEADEVWTRTCASTCTWQYPDEVQRCLAEMDEACSTYDECLGLD